MPKKPAPTPTKTNSRIKLGIAAIVLLVLVLIFGKIFNFISNLYQPINADISITQRSSSWDGKSHMNVLVRGEDTAVLAFNPQEKKLVVMPIPEQTYLEVPGGFGWWQMDTVYSVGQAEAKPIGPKLLKLSATALLGLPIEGYIDITDLESANTSEAFVHLLREDFFGYLSVLSDIKSDLTMMELWNFKSGLAGIRFDRVETWNLEEQDVFSEKTLEDKSKVLVPNMAAIDTLMQNIAEGVFTSNRVNIAVFNSTSHPGLALKGARIIGNVGGNVVIVTNATIPQERSYIAVKGDAGKDIVQRISQLYDLDCSDNPNCSIIICSLGAGENACPTDDIEVTHSRAEITVVLGEDFYRNYR